MSVLETAEVGRKEEKERRKKSSLVKGYGSRENSDKIE